MRRIAVFSLVMLVAACAGNIRPGRQYEDALLAQQVREAIAADRSLRVSNLTVDARAGVVTLTGVASSSAQRERAGELARSVRGVTHVENLLGVK